MYSANVGLERGGEYERDVRVGISLLPTLVFVNESSLLGRLRCDG